MSLLAFGDVRVGDQVAETIGFDDESDLSGGVLLDDSSDRINVSLVLGKTVVCNSQFSVGRKSGTITVGQIVDDECTNDLGLCTSSILLLDVSEISLDGRHFGGGITGIVSICRGCTLLVKLTAKQKFQFLQQR
jgi:hypothetical protein